MEQPIMNTLFKLQKDVFTEEYSLQKVYDYNIISHTQILQKFEYI